MKIVIDNKNLRREAERQGITCLDPTYRVYTPRTGRQRRGRWSEVRCCPGYTFVPDSTVGLERWELLLAGTDTPATLPDYVLHAMCDQGVSTESVSVGDYVQFRSNSQLFTGVVARVRGRVAGLRVPETTLIIWVPMENLTLYAKNVPR